MRKFLFPRIHGPHDDLCIRSTSNPKSRNHEDSQAPDSYPARAYFIVFKQSDSCNENILFTALHIEDVETELARIRMHTKNETGNEMETAAR